MALYTFFRKLALFGHSLASFIVANHFVCVTRRNSTVKKAPLEAMLILNRNANYAEALAFFVAAKDLVEALNSRINKMLASANAADK